MVIVRGIRAVEWDTREFLCEDEGMGIPWSTSEMSRH